MILCAQLPEKALWVEVAGGGGSGVWTHNKGTSSNGQFNTEGWERSHSSAFVNTEFNVAFRYRRWTVGLGGTYDMFLDRTIYAADHSDNNPNLILFAENNFLRLNRVYLIGGYNIVHKPKYRMGPQVKMGRFWENSIHPDKANFKRFFTWEVAIDNEVQLAKRFVLALRPHYVSYIIYPENRVSKSERHRIFDFGMVIGLRINLFEK